MKKFLPFLLITLLMGCAEDDAPDTDNDPEIMTTVKVVMSPSGGITDAVFLYRDADGAGGEEPEIKTDTLFVNTTYQVDVHFLNEQETPPDSLNSEIREEATDHQVFLEFDPDMGLNWSYRDVDMDGHPLGLNMQVVTDTTTGLTDMTLTLVHDPLKFAEEVSAGNLANADGENDIQVSWEVFVQ